MKCEITAGWRTGRHAHGEEAIHVLAGTGFAVIDGARYDWKPGTTLHVPYRAEHQLVNTGRESAVYLAAHTIELDFATKLGRLVQLEEKAKDDGALAQRYPAQTSQVAPDGRASRCTSRTRLMRTRAACRAMPTPTRRLTREPIATPGSGSSWARGKSHRRDERLPREVRRDVHDLRRVTTSRVKPYAH